MKRDKSIGFSIMELVITTVIMGVVLIIAPVVMLKRATKPKQMNKPDNIAECSTTCIYNAKESILNNGLETKQTFDYVKHSNQPYTIELIGGGGGGTDKSAGYAGGFTQVKTFSLDSNEDATGADTSEKYKGILTGFYLLEAGKGGETGESGYPSRICIIPAEDANKNPSGLHCTDAGYTIIAEAAGGITSNEVEPELPNGGDYHSFQKVLENEITVNNKTASFGLGGLKGKSGVEGAIIIR